MTQSHQAKYQSTSRAELQRLVFGSDIGQNDHPGLVISVRDAAERAGHLTNAEEALDLLGQAERIDDHVLAGAVVRVALDHDWADVGRRFCSTHPDRAEALIDLWMRTPITPDPIPTLTLA
jgi:hypothetical protein